MKVAITTPPNIDEINKVLTVDLAKTIFTYGDCIFNPSNLPLTQDLIIHEMQHAKQQAQNETVAKLWWMRYLTDPWFRVTQEAEAYGAQYRYICTQVKDPNQQLKYRMELAGHLSSAMYGNAISKSEAMILIRKHAKI